MGSRFADKPGRSSDYSAYGSVTPLLVYMGFAFQMPSTVVQACTLLAYLFILCPGLCCGVLYVLTPRPDSLMVDVGMDELFPLAGRSPLQHVFLRY